MVSKNGVNKSIEECKLKCNENPTCEGIAYDPATKTCQLKSSKSLAPFVNDKTNYYGNIGPTYSPPASSPSFASSSNTGLGSDRRLKDEITLIGKHRGYNVYRWVWNDIATSTYGYRGSEIGFLADELEPKYIGTDSYGYKYIKEGTSVAKYVKALRSKK